MQGIAQGPMCKFCLLNRLFRLLSWFIRLGWASPLESGACASLDLVMVTNDPEEGSNGL